jgi:hypothetical protein
MHIMESQIQVTDINKGRTLRNLSSDYRLCLHSLSASAGMRALRIGVNISDPTQDSEFHDQLSNY